jgi:hypothetical protein
MNLQNKKAARKGEKGRKKAERKRTIDSSFAGEMQPL